MDTVAGSALVRRSSIGFDHLFTVLDRAVKSQDQADYPPYNIERTGEDAYRLTLAVAGWAAAEITVTAAPHLLVVSGLKLAEGDKRYLYRGIPSGAFEHRFDLADDVQVRGAQLTNGLLTIELARVVPAGPTLRHIPITDAGSRLRSRRSPDLRLVPSATDGGSERRATA